MQINVTARHGSLSDVTQQKVTAKAEKLNRFFERLAAVEVVIDLADPNRPSVDLDVSAEHKHDFRARARADNLLEAVDDAVHKLEQQLKKYKEKLQTRGRNAAAKRPGPATVDGASHAAPPLDAGDAEVD